MAENQQEQDRSEPATPFKLREAKKRGQVAKSPEVNSVVVLGAGFLVLGFWSAEALLDFIKIVFSTADQFDGTAAAAMIWYRWTLEGVISVLWPAAAGVMIAGVVANIMQTGFIFSGYPLKPDMNKLNPVQGFKRVFSKRMLVDALKSVLKIVFFGLILYFTIRSLLPAMMHLPNLEIGSHRLFLSESVQVVLGRLLLAVLAVALLDLAYTRWDYAKRMRMSRREIKEEVRRREGDPLIRAKLRALQKEALKRAASLRNIPEADILITNPTHLSVAIQYDRATMKAPLVVAKGAGELALKMRGIAKANKVQIVENKAVARHLFNKVNLDEPVPAELFPAVAKMLAWVYLQRKMKSSSSSERAHYAY